ncbi:MAG: Qat anti-phage system TatD family nuclease QatD [Luteolibacter sp.]
MIDFHSHLDLYTDAISVARETSQRNRFTLAVTTSPKAWVATSRILGAYPNIKIGLGLHPEIVEEKAAERDLLIDYIRNAEFVGETGLDGSKRFRSSFELQRSIFTSLLRECTAQGGRIISIHSRSAATQVIDLLNTYPDVGIPVLHWFSGSESELKRAIDRGCWFSVGPAMSCSASGRKILRLLPLDRILPESDGPFAVVGKRPIMPWAAISVSAEIARCRNLEVGEVEDQFLENANKILKQSKSL